MNCEKYADWISLYVDNELEEQDQIEFEQHLASCDLCREEVAVFRSIMMDLSTIEVIEPPEGFHENLMEKISLQNEQDSKLVTLPIRKRKWYKNLEITSRLAAVFIFSLILIKPLKIDLFKSPAPDMVSMEEEIQGEETVSETRMIVEPENKMPEKPSIDLMEESEEEVAEEEPISGAQESQTDSVADPKNMKEKPVKESLEKAQAKILERPKAELAQEEIMLSNHEPRILSEDILVEETWTIMTGNYAEDLDYILKLAEELEIEKSITKERATEGLQKQKTTLEMLINTKQKSQLEDQVMGFEKNVVTRDDDISRKDPQRIKLVIVITES